VISPGSQEPPQAFSELEKEVGNSVSRLLVNELLKRLPGDVEAFATANIHRDITKLERLAHNLSGSLTVMKLQKGHALASNLEKACRGQEGEDIIRQTVFDLMAYLESLLDATRNYLK
jgi:HPt (histidine-containing phosphotransfer) domain-containing protein